MARRISAEASLMGVLGAVVCQTQHTGIDTYLPISIGDVPLILYFGEAELLEKAGRRYAEFRALRPEGLPIFLQSTPPQGEGPSEFSYRLDGATLHLEPAAARFCGVRHEYALDSLIRILLSIMLLPRHGFLLHAATVVRDGRAYVFTGRSGAGKSTIASFSPVGNVLTDEISLLRCYHSGWHAHGTPFWGEFRAAGLNQHFPVAGIYVLVQASENRVEPLPPKEGLRAILPNVLFFSSNKPMTEKLLRVMAEAAETIPFYRLHFRRDSTFWGVITA
jgi:hypothetical protein